MQMMAVAHVGNADVIEPTRIEPSLLFDGTDCGCGEHSRAPASGSGLTTDQGGPPLVLTLTGAVAFLLVRSRERAWVRSASDLVLCGPPRVSAGPDSFGAGALTGQGFQGEIPLA
jgi:hypothetical protein